MQALCIYNIYIEYYSVGVTKITYVSVEKQDILVRTFKIIFLKKNIHFTHIYVIKKPLEKNTLKTLLFYTYYENHLLFVYLHLFVMYGFFKKIILNVRTKIPKMFHKTLLKLEKICIETRTKRYKYSSKTERNFYFRNKNFQIRTKLNEFTQL